MVDTVSFPAGLSKMAKRRGMRQFVKFVIVGASSTVIDFGLHWFLFKHVDGSFNQAIRNAVYGVLPGVRGHFDPAFVVIKAISFITATFNGFHWNRHWSFRAAERDLAHRQLLRFYLVYAIGLLINTTVAGSIYTAGEGKKLYLISLIVATIVTTAWTFPMTKFWTFKERK
jgi:putative flippase GtrA